tara:strand:+ start:491 stop:856 length:366 start_codon:yes stop_codon:yes gene_type:complete
MSYDAHVSAYAALIIDIVLDAANDIDGAPDACEAGPIGLGRAAEWRAEDQPDGVYHQVEELVHAMEYEKSIYGWGYPKGPPTFALARYVTYLMIPDGVCTLYLAYMSNVLLRSLEHQLNPS